MFRLLMKVRQPCIANSSKPIVILFIIATD